MLPLLLLLVASLPAVLRAGDSLNLGELQEKQFAEKVARQWQLLEEEIKNAVLQGDLLPSSALSPSEKDDEKESKEDEEESRDYEEESKEIAAGSGGVEELPPKECSSGQTSSTPHPVAWLSSLAGWMLSRQPSSQKDPANLTNSAIAVSSPASDPSFSSAPLGKVRTMSTPTIIHDDYKPSFEADDH